MQSTTISSIVHKHRPDLSRFETLYRHLHSSPELSFLESRTCDKIAAGLSHITKYKVVPHIGGHGLAAILKNGAGPTVLLRADIDGLPVEEKTGLPYASTARMKNVEGVEMPVMHACGHDMHITALLAAAEVLEASTAEWAGTLVLVFQPAEEKGAGARAMVDDGLYTKHGVPVPDVVLGAHVMPDRAGTIGLREGAMGSAADSMKIKLHGWGGHASQPHQTVDPVVMASFVTTRLQTLVSREVSPSDAAVVTVASIKAGETENIIPDSAELKVNVRTYDERVRKRVLDGVKRIVEAECKASRAPKEAEYSFISRYPVTNNDATLTQKLSESMRAHFGDAFSGDHAPLKGSEDFPILGTSVDRPVCYWVYGGIERQFWDKTEREGQIDEKVPINHSPFFAPEIEPTLRTAVDGYAVAVLTWLQKS
ncbi:MAG: hypothetical protein M1828_001677 [Chrysothrix sp. TS-e1954]|nr:MAG: hypothetical protein M1828_001677 [Chrysothrix sp. TS-e1954]